MSCPPKFADLHKSADDAFNKDYFHGFCNLKHAQNYCMGNMGSGTITTKWNFNHHAAKSCAEIEAKHTNKFLSAFPTSVTTKTLNVDTGILKYKTELPVNGGKITFVNDVDCNNWTSKSNSLEFQTGRDRLSANLKLNQNGGLTNMLSSVTANAVIGVTGDVFVAGNVDYNINKGALSHHVKLVSKMAGNNVSLNLKDAADSELVLSRKLEKSLSMCPMATFNCENVHVKSQYGIKSADWGAQIAVDGNWDCGSWSTKKSQIAFDCKTYDAKFSDHVKISDSLTAILSLKNNFNDGFFKKCSVGMSLNFNA